jgi:hypothetical protein
MAAVSMACAAVRHSHVIEMRNPWLKKNPYLSMWLSASNTVAGAISAQANAKAKRQAASVSTLAAREIAEAWSAAMFGTARSGRRRRR